MLLIIARLHFDLMSRPKHVIPQEIGVTEPHSQAFPIFALLVPCILLNIKGGIRRNGYKPIQTRDISIIALYYFDTYVYILTQV